MLDDFPSLDDGGAQDLVGRVDIDDNVANNILKHNIVVGAYIPDGLRTLRKKEIELLIYMWDHCKEKCMLCGDEVLRMLPWV